MDSRHLLPIRTPVPGIARAAGAAFLVAAALLATARPTQAHLSMFRQGAESSGTLETGDRFGTAIAVGDFNGDGYDDAAVGAPEDAVGSTVGSGMVTIHWGSEFGTTHEGSVFLTVLLTGETPYEDAHFGQALAAGDFDADGYDDLVVGAPGDRVSIFLGAGRIYAYRGGASGLTYVDSFTQADAGESSEPGDAFGSSFAVGNWNGDPGPYDDLAVGVPGEDSGAGMVVTFYGSFLFLNGNDAYRPSDFGAANTAGIGFGHALAAGNLLGGAEDDLAIGCPNRTVSGNNLCGSVFVLRGTSATDMTPDATILTAAYHDAVQPGGNFGTALAAGRFYGGSYDALAVGEPGRDWGPFIATGRVVLIRGGAAGWGASERVYQTSYGGAEGDLDQFGGTLAAGFFESGSTYEDLAVGIPGEGRSSGAPDAGAVAILYGGTSGPDGGHGWAAFDQGALNEWRFEDDLLGAALAFGHVDGSGRGALFVGAPGNDEDTGIVHLIAPWRQTYGLECRHSVVTDCAGNLVFTQKPFDQVWIASTTKTMTVLLAAERSRLVASHPDYVDLDWEYTVPSWCSVEVPGSQVPLATGETMTLRELMWTCMFMSGNDAAYAIADLCEGGLGPDDSVPFFVAAMNARAEELGMDGTHFHNPAGLDNEPVGPELGEHYSTPHDMMLLARAAMEDPIVRDIVGSTSFTMTRRWANSTQEEWEFLNIFRGVLGNAIEPMNGIKGGNTPRAQATGLFSAGVPNRGDALVTTFYTPSVEGNHYTPDAAHLMELGTAECGDDFTFTAFGYQPLYLGEFPTCEECVEGRTLALEFGPPGDLVIDSYVTQGEDLRARFEMNHLTEFYFQEGESVEFGIGPFQERTAFTIRNMGVVEADILFTPSAGGTAVPYSIPVGGAVTVPAYASPTPLAQYTATIEDIGDARPVHIVVETTYGFDVDVQGLRGGDTPAFAATLLRDPALVNDGMQIRVVGNDPVPGGQVLVVAHEPGATVDVGPLEAEPGDGTALTQMLAGPNPFTAGTSLSFTLRRSAQVDAEIFDASGRLVRSVGERSLAAGPWSLTWDGTDAGGVPTPAGVYFYRVTVDGVGAGTGKLVRVE